MIGVQGRWGGHLAFQANLSLNKTMTIVYIEAVDRHASPQEDAVKRIWTIIGVADVASSFRWYQSLLGLSKTSPAHEHFGQIVDSDGTVLLCLHLWGSHDHPTLASPAHAQPGNGLILFFRVDDFDAALLRARALANRLEEEANVNPATGTREFALRDPDGYYVMVSAT